jgi:AcrR family transcriptional regulator
MSADWVPNIGRVFSDSQRVNTQASSARTLTPMAASRPRAKTSRKKPPEQGRKHAAFARTRAHILNATIELLGGIGPSATIEQVAAHADVAPSTLYQHFTDRQELFTAALVTGHAQWEEWMRTVVQQVPGDLERFALSGRLFLRASQTHPHYARMAAHSLGAIAEQMPLFSRHSGEFIRQLAQKRLIATDRVQQRIDAYTACLFGALIVQFRNENTARADDDIELALSILGVPAARAKALAHAPLPAIAKRRN